MATNIQLEKALLELQARVEFLESLNPDFKTKKFLADQQRKNAEREAKELADREEAERQRLLRRNRYNDEMQRLSPKNVLCERSGEYVAENIVSHLCADGRCIHNVRKAKSAGLISKELYENIVAEGKLETGCIIPVGFSSNHDNSIQPEREFSPVHNPLAGESAPSRPIKFVGIGNN